jgi:hypothetical protein
MRGYKVENPENPHNRDDTRFSVSLAGDLEKGGVCGGHRLNGWTTTRASNG